jgi:hypothetical protein
VSRLRNCLLWAARPSALPALRVLRPLDYAAERILLRKVGGGYVFLHRMLLDYFAARYVKPSGEGKEPAKLSPIEGES